MAPLPAWIAGSLLLTLANAVVAENRIKDEVGFYIATYGEIRPEQDPQVALTQRIFARVQAVAENNDKRLPKLVVINSRTDPWAIALPSGHIVLSKQAISICHQLPKTEADACLAFILGHEIAHLSHDDFWHHEVYGFLTTHPGTRDLANFLRNHRDIRDKEMEADDAGFVYAAMAGYPVDLLLETANNKPHFFNFWVQQTHTQADTTHPGAEERAALLRSRLDVLKDKLSFFEFGVRLSHFDACDDGIYFLEEFQKTFPGREVLSTNA